VYVRAVVRLRRGGSGVLSMKIYLWNVRGLGGINICMYACMNVCIYISVVKYMKESKDTCVK